MVMSARILDSMVCLENVEIDDQYQKYLQAAGAVYERKQQEL